MNNPLLVEYAREPWAMEPERLRQFMSAVANRPPMSETLAALKVDRPLPYRAEGDAGVIPISGVLLKSVPGWARLYGINATGYDEIRQMLAMAVEDRRVARIELRITSPGGMVAGGMETAEAIRAADKIKPVTASIEDLGASGAYWLATSAGRITANANAEVGSIGVFTYFADDSKAWEAEGVQWIVVRSGPHKGMGIDKITPEQLAAVQEVIDGMASHFIDQVAAGRNVPREKAAEWATGRVWLAPAALELGLIDSITNTQASGKPDEDEDKNKENSMDNPVVTNQADVATASKAAADAAVAAEKKRFADVKAAFPSDPAFALDAIEAGWDVVSAKAERHDRLEKQAAETPKGAKPVEYGESDSGSGVDFMAQARQRARESKISVTNAMRQIQAEDPQAYAKFLAKEQERSVRTHSGKGKPARVSV